MAQKQVQQVDILVTQASVDAAKRLTDQFAEQKGMVDALLNSLKLVDTQLKALKSAQIAKTPNYAQGAGAAQETQVQKTAISADAKRIQAYKDLLKLDQDRGALLMSQSKMLDEEGKRVKKINDLEALALNLRAAQFRAKEAQLKQDDQAQKKAEQLVRIFQKRIEQINAEAKAQEAATKREKEALAALGRMQNEIASGQAQRDRQREKEALAALRRMQTEIANGQREREKREQEFAERVRRNTEERIKQEKRAAEAAERARMQPLTDRRNAQRSREMSELRLFGDGGASLLKIQTSLMANYAIINSVTGAFRAAATEAVAFDASLRDLQAIAKITDNNMVSLKTTIMETADTSRFSVSQVSQAAVILAQAGLSNSQIDVSIKAVGQLATATGTDLSKAVDIATSVIGVFNMEASRMGEVANTLTQAMNASKLDIEKLTLGIQYAGNTAYDAGVSFEELTAGLGAMANAGIRSGSTLGTGMRQILVSLEKPSEKLVSNLNKLGLTTEDVNLKTKGLYQVMTTLREAGFSAADAIDSFEVRSAAAFIALSNNLPLMEAMQQSFYGSVAAAQANETQMRSLSAQSQRFTNSLGSLAYVGLEPVMYGLRDMLSSLADFMISLRSNEGMVRTITTAVVALGVAFTALKIGNLAAGLVGMLPALKALDTGLSGVIVTTQSLSATQAASTVTTNVFSAALATFRSRLALIQVSAAIAGTSMLSLGNAFRVAQVGLAAVMSTAGVLLPILAAVGAAYYTWTSASAGMANETQRLNSALDIHRTKVDQQRGVMDQYKAKLTEVENKIQSLSNRTKELDRNSEMLKAEVRNVQSQFLGMTSSIDGTESSAQQLITKLQELWAQLQKDYILSIQVQIGNLAGLATALNAQRAIALTGVTTSANDTRTGDPTLDAAIAAFKDPKLRNDPVKFAEARANLQNAINSRTAEVNSPDFGMAAVNAVSTTVTGGRYGQYIAPKTKDQLTADQQEALLAAQTAASEQINMAAEFMKGVDTVGGLDAQLMDVQTQTQLANVEGATATARQALQTRGIPSQRLDLERAVAEDIAAAEKAHVNDPVGMFNALQGIAAKYESQIGTTISDLQNSGLDQAAVDEEVGKWKALGGTIGSKLNDAFDPYKRMTNISERDSENTLQQVFSGALSSLGKSNTPAELDAARQRARDRSEALLEAELKNIETDINPKAPNASVDRAEAEANARERADERLRRIEEEAQQQLEQILAGNTGAVQAKRNAFDNFMLDRESAVRGVKSGIASGATLQDEALKVMDTELKLAEARAAQVAQELAPLAALAADNKLQKGTPELAEYERLSAEQERLKSFINNLGTDMTEVMSKPAKEYGFSEQRSRAFNATMQGFRDRIDSVVTQVNLKRLSPEAAQAEYAKIQKDMEAQAAAIRSELAPLEDKLNRKQSLTDAERKVYNQASTEETRLASMIGDNRSNVEGATGNGGGSGGGKADSGAGRDFNLMMDNLKTDMSNTQQDLKYNSIDPAKGLADMEAIVAKAKEELEIRRQQMAVQKEGSAEYNRLKGEERTLLGFIREEEANIREEKERQGVAQVNLLDSVKAWAVENLNVGKALEDGFLGVLSSMKNGLSTLFSDLMTGTKSAKEAFRDFAMSVVNAIQNVIAEMMAMYVMKKILGIFGYTLEGGSAMEIVPTMTGGAVRKAGGGMVSGNVARDSKLHMLMPGEYVLRKKAVDMIGRDTLDAMNAMGNRAMASGGHVGVANQKKGPMGMTNVYVVAPEQQPVPGPSDIIAVINDDIARNGPTKKLIKTVAMGY